MNGFILEKGGQYYIHVYGRDGGSLDKVINGNSSAYLWGYVRYEDIWTAPQILLRQVDKAAAAPEALIGGEPRLYWSQFGGEAYNRDVVEPEQDDSAELR